VHAFGAVDSACVKTAHTRRPRELPRCLFPTTFSAACGSFMSMFGKGWPAPSRRPIGLGVDLRLAGVGLRGFHPFRSSGISSDFASGSFQPLLRMPIPCLRQQALDRVALEGIALALSMFSAEITVPRAVSARRHKRGRIRAAASAPSMGVRVIWFPSGAEQVGQARRLVAVVEDAEEAGVVAVPALGGAHLRRRAIRAPERVVLDLPAPILRKLPVTDGTAKPPP